MNILSSLPYLLGYRDVSGMEKERGRGSKNSDRIKKLKRHEGVESAGTKNMVLVISKYMPGCTKNLEHVAQGKKVLYST